VVKVTDTVVLTSYVAFGITREYDIIIRYGSQRHPVGNEPG